MKSFHKKSISVIMAVMLMICAFAAGSDTVSCLMRISEMTAGNETLEHPGAGEFFAGSLPQTEPQSVREASVCWQDLLGARGVGVRAALWMVSETTVLQQIAQRPWRSELKKIIPVHHSGEIIVCYIHNKDGQKG